MEGDCNVYAPALIDMNAPIMRIVYLCELSRLIIPRTFHAHNCCVTYPRTITRDAGMFVEDENFIEISSKSVPFRHFSWKVNPICFLFQYIKVCKNKL